MGTYIFLQQYWWLVVSLLGAILVFLLFVQGGNSLLFCLGKTEEHRKMMVIPPDVSGNLRLPHWSLSVARFLLHFLCSTVPVSAAPIGFG